MKYKIEKNDIYDYFIFSNEDLPKLPENVIQELSCFHENFGQMIGSETGFFLFNVTPNDLEIIEEIKQELFEIGFELIQEKENGSTISS
ncbi:MAG TPA: hypothetical protein VJ583_03410 [Nitrososphaeraceae archaeon]|nr:hypothetical protein [Nitrososphaeraceae archaeon]